MPFKLNLTQPSPEPSPTEKSRKEISSKKGYKSPVGWWAVSTEGDVEGMRTEQLGTYYGHVAEIAFFLAKKAFYKLTFTTTIAPIVGEAGEAAKSVRRKYKASYASVWVGLGLGSILSQDADHRAVQLAAWLDTDEIEVHARTPQASYYGASYLKLKVK